MATPTKKPHPSHPQPSTPRRASQNSNPNQPISTPRRKPINTPLIKPPNSKKPTPNTLIPAPPPKPTTPTKFLDSNNSRRTPMPNPKSPRTPAKASVEDSRNSKTPVAEISDSPNCLESSGSAGLDGSSKVRRMKRRVLEEARSSIPVSGCGRVMHLVNAFERLLSLPKGSQVSQGQEVMHLVLPEVDGSEKAVEIEEASSLIDGGDERLNSGSSSSEGGGRRRSAGDSMESSERNWSKMLKVTCQQPFKLRTEQRGRKKEEEFINKVKEMLLEEEKQRIPIAQSLPWTTEDPERLVKPRVKESTEPIDLVLHSDVRAVERAEFDHQIAQRLSHGEQLKLEREQQQKLEEEEETKRLRRELVPRARPMPQFNRSFIPKKSSRPQTVPKEPRFHARR